MFIPGMFPGLPAKKKPPTLVGAKSVSGAGTTSTINVSLTDIAGGLGEDPAENDIVIVAYCVAGGANADVDMAARMSSSGYTLIDELYRAESGSPNLAVWWKKMTSSPDTQVSFAGTSNAAYAYSVAIHVWRNLDTTSPINTYTTATASDSSLANPPSITPTVAGAVVLGVGGASHFQGTGTYSSSDLDNFVTSGGSDSQDSVIGMGSYEGWVSGALDLAAFSFSLSNVNNSGWAAFAISLRPV